MAQVTVRSEMEFDEPFLVEGLPGLGLASKIATDFLVDRLDMSYHASVSAEGIPPVAVFEQDRHEVQPPVRIYASEEHDLLALTSDILVSPLYAGDFADVVVDWIQDTRVTPLFLSGLPSEKETPGLYGVSTGDAASLLDAAGIAPPDGPGLIGGPTGALLSAADERGVDAAGLIVETDPQFPDPIAARALIDRGIEKIAGFDVDTTPLSEQAEQIREQKEQFAEMIRQAETHETSAAFPEGMYQ